MSDTIPVAQLRAFVERIERIEADIKDLNGDKSEVYKELRGCGFDVKAVRAVVAKRKLDTADREERDAMFDLYWSALNGTGTEHATHVCVHGANLSYSQSGLTYADEKGRGDHHVQPVGTLEASAKSAQDDVGATASSTNSAHKPAGDLAADNGDKDRGSFPVGGPVHSHSPAAIPLGAANSAGEAPSSSRVSPATDTDDDGDDDVPAFIKQNKPDCLKLKDGHCRLSFATSALCAECNQRRAMARALA